ncbi:MAG: hypothetical protein HFJ44_05780 [Clostridia bacterium]|jgi:hypothetical protein|nr:hypothetical protein [Clostridia bacterium]
MEKETVINQRVHDFSKSIDIIQTILIYLIALLVPTFLGELLKNVFPATSIVVTKSQLIIGSMVNASLIVTAMNLKGWAKILGVVTMPSISTILGGYVFKTASVFMVYMIPAIWVGNFALVYAYKKILVQKNKNYFIAGIVGIVIKVAIIFGAFGILNLLGIFPQKLVTNLQTAMGMTQGITATVGMIIAFVIYKLECRK